MISHMEFRRDDPLLHGRFMRAALDEARAASAIGEVPVGAVLVHAPTGRILVRTHNEVETTPDPTAHAEMLAVRRAAAMLGSPRLTECDLYVTLEPCPMCAQALAFARIRRVYYGAEDPKGGGVDNGARIFAQTSCHHRPEVYGGISEREAAELLRAFFAARRQNRQGSS